MVAWDSQSSGVGGRVMSGSLAAPGEVLSLTFHCTEHRPALPEVRVH